ncbi:unnamed protein product [Paramecium pentaurelia]|uniref:MORN repeat protein n=1 Tax=Paramecium pentaurelia TaxID=43138 RepID=A0A8S1YBT1_9CILI|nr:unnamed protein product [Paramecium pentaurelia]
MGTKNTKETKKPEISINDQKIEKIVDQISFNQRVKSKRSEQKSLPIVYQYKIQSQLPQQQNDIFQENDLQFLNCNAENQECGNLNQSTFNLQPADYGLGSLNDGQIQSQDDKIIDKLIDVHESKNKLRIIPLIIQDEQNPIVLQIQDDLKIELNQHHPTEQEAIPYQDKYIQINNLRIAGIWRYLSPYEGILKNKQPFQLFDKSIYIGDWFKKKKQGFGLLINDEYIYEGYWYDDKYHGNGKIIYGNRNVYIGQFKYGLYNGEGLYIKNIDQGNKIYEGEWLQGLKNGMGKESMPDGTIFIGQFKDNERHGYGKLFNIRDQYVFEGQWIEGITQDKGTLIWQDGKRFEGGWQNNMMNGQGVFIWPGGKKYVGNYVNNLRDGYGEYQYKDGKIYKGMWKEGLMNGQGIIIYPNDTHERGIWKQGKRVDLQGKQKHKKKLI